MDTFLKQFIISIYTLLLSSCEVAPPYSGTNINGAMPASSENAVVIEHEGFTISYLSQYKQAEWVSYTLTGPNVEKKIPRTDNFAPDPKYPTCATDSDYKYSGYDRGHLFPAANAWTTQIMDESFYYTNICPQNNSFNSGVWNRIETQVRKWAVEFDTIHVVTGSILHENLKTIGNNVAVPEYMFKVVVVNTETHKQAIALLLKNKWSDVKNAAEFALTVDELEEITGMDFCINLPDYLENEIEKSYNLSDWGLK